MMWWGVDEPCRAASMERGSQASSGSLEQAGFSIGKIKISTNGTMGASVEPAITSWTGWRLLLLKDRALSGLSEVSLERWDVCRGFSYVGFLEVFTDQQQTCLYHSPSCWGLELQGEGWCSGRRMHTLPRDAGAKPFRWWWNLKCSWSTKSFVLVLTATASSAMKHSHTGGTSPA